MRHRKKRTRFGKQKNHREAILRNLTKGLLKTQRIKTTHVRAKETKKLVEKLITIAKQDTLYARRRVFSILGDRGMVVKLFREIAPLFKDTNGGYTRIVPYAYRKGDGASMVFLELTKKIETVQPKKTKKKKEELSKGKSTLEIQKEKLQKAAPELKPDVKEEKTIEKIKKEKAKEETRKIEKKKSFIMRLRGFFRGKRNM